MLVFARNQYWEKRSLKFVGLVKRSLRKTMKKNRTIEFALCCKVLGCALLPWSWLQWALKIAPLVSQIIQSSHFHHFSVNLHEYETSTTISVIPASDEKYILLQMSVQVNKFKWDDNKNSRVLEVRRLKQALQRPSRKRKESYLRYNLTLWI